MYQQGGLGKGMTALKNQQSQLFESIEGSIKKITDSLEVSMSRDIQIPIAINRENGV